MFKSADTHGKGTISREEFAAIIQQQHFGLDQRLVNRLLSDADGDADGMIHYAYASTVGSAWQR